MMRHTFATAALLLAVHATLLAQGRILPITEQNGSLESMALGGTRSGEHHSTFIYSNPLSALTSADTLRADYSLQLTPTDGPDYSLHTLTASYRLGSGALLAGVHYQSMGTLNSLANSSFGQVIGEKRHMYAYTADLGYAMPLSRLFAAYALLGYDAEKVSNSVSSVRLSAGVGLADSLSAAHRSWDYSLQLAVAGVGRYSYSGGTHGALWPRFSLGGSLGTDLTDRQRLSLYTEGGLFLHGGAELCLGLAYSIGGTKSAAQPRYDVMAGLHTGDGDGALSAGLSARLRPVTVAIAARLALQPDQNSTYALSVGFAL